MGRRTQAVQGGLHVQLATGKRIQKNGLAAEAALTPRLLVRVAFPQEVLCPRPCEGRLAGACGTPNGDARANGESVVHMALAPHEVVSSTPWLILRTYAMLLT
jgi:hypothetical protein